MSSLVKSLIFGIIVIALLYIVNAMMSSAGFFGAGIDDYSARLLVFIGINIILATSLNLINGFTGQFSIGHAGFMAVGAYSSAYFTVTYGKQLETAFSSLGEVGATSIILLIAILIGAVVAAIVGLIVGIPSLRLRGDYLAIVTLGFAEIIRIVILNIDAVGGATGYTVPGYASFLWIGIFAVITVVVVHNIVKSDAGRALISIREDELAAEAMGVNTTRYKVISFVISSAFAGIAGVLFAHYNKFLSTNDFQFIKSFEVIIMIVLGGMGSMTGAIIGAIVVTLLPELLRQLSFIQVPFIQVSSSGEVLLSSIPLDSLRLVIFALILILTMILRPQGIFGTNEFGLSWLKRPRKETAGTETVGDSEGTPIAQQEEAKRLTSEEED
ncbi:MAG: branched-chain amino acid ABC transporter permease [Acidobacteria bacterium]|jgi:branched-chain amino acid transport system permease protein|nr:branched-chain amino acid ABC transporter permease [Acidobacteriota bacterium]